MRLLLPFQPQRVMKEKATETPGYQQVVNRLIVVYPHARMRARLGDEPRSLKLKQPQNPPKIKGPTSSGTTMGCPPVVVVTKREQRVEKLKKWDARSGGCYPFSRDNLSKKANKSKEFERS
jgi:hypothetical protein